jgi:CRP-like cAMP-binding protein
MPIDDVCMFTDVSKRIVERIMAHFRCTGGIVVHGSKTKHHLHRALSDYDVEVSE